MDIARASLKIFLANVAGSVVMLLGVMFFARELGAGSLGTFFLFQAAVAILATPADFGLRGATEKRVSEGSNRPQFLSTAALLKVAPLSILAVGIVLFRGQVNAYLGADLALLLAGSLFLHEYAKLMVRVIQGELRVGETAILQFTRRAVWVGLGAVLVLAGFGVEALVYGYLVGDGVMFAWGFHRRSTPFGRPSVAAARSLFDYAKFNFVSSLGGSFYSWLDVAVIGLFLSNTHVAAYEVAWRVTNLFLLFSSAISTSIFPQVSEWNASDEAERIERAIYDAMLPALVFVVPAFFGAVVFAQDVLGIMFGPEFVIAWVPLIVLMGDKVLQAVQLIVGRSLLAVDQPALAARATVASTAANLGLNLVFVWQFGLVGAAVATVLASALNDALHYVYLSRFVTVRVPVREIGWSVVASAGMALALVAIRQVYAVQTIPDLVGLVLFGGVVYGALVATSSQLRVKMARYVPALLGR